MTRNAALVVAAGSGSRAGGGQPKQYVEVAGKPLLRHSVEALLAHPAVDVVRVVIGAGHEAMFRVATAGLDLPPPINGGATRRESVHRGLEALAEDEEARPEVVLIHDAARPFLPASIIDNLLEALKRHAGALPGLPVVDTIKRVDETGLIVETPPRERLRKAQTPQAFRFAAILAAYRAAAALKEDFSDDSAVAERAGMQVAIIEGTPSLRKVTYGEDFRWAEQVARQLGLG